MYVYTESKFDFPWTKYLVFLFEKKRPVMEMCGVFKSPDPFVEYEMKY